MLRKIIEEHFSGTSFVSVERLSNHISRKSPREVSLKDFSRLV